MHARFSLIAAKERTTAEAVRGEKVSHLRAGARGVAAEAPVRTRRPGAKRTGLRHGAQNVATRRVTKASRPTSVSSSPANGTHASAGKTAPDDAETLRTPRHAPTPVSNAAAFAVAHTPDDADARHAESADGTAHATLGSHDASRHRSRLRNAAPQPFR